MFSLISLICRCAKRCIAWVCANKLSAPHRNGETAYPYGPVPSTSCPFMAAPSQILASDANTSPQLPLDAADFDAIGISNLQQRSRQVLPADYGDVLCDLL